MSVPATPSTNEPDPNRGNFWFALFFTLLGFLGGAAATTGVFYWKILPSRHFEQAGAENAAVGAADSGQTKTSGENAARPSGSPPVAAADKDKRSPKSAGAGAAGGGEKAGPRRMPRPRPPQRNPRRPATRATAACRLPSKRRP